MSETKHTPTPWRPYYAGIDDTFIQAVDGVVAKLSSRDADIHRVEANAALIVTAVNSHQPMQKALDDLLNQVIHWGDDRQLEAIAAEISAAEAALRLAEGSEE